MSALVRYILGTTVLFTVAETVGHAQPPARDQPRLAPSSLTIQGRVIADADGEPVRNARVDLASDATVPAVLTDEDGRFALDAVTAGPHTVAATKAGFARTLFATTGHVKTGTVVTASARRLNDIEIRMSKGGVIAGRVVDAYGDPVPAITVIAERVVRARGRVETERQASGDTDDLGAYRLFGLPPGEFVIAIAGSRRNLIIRGAATPTTYYRHATAADEAQIIRIATGDEVSGIDLTLPLPPLPAHAPATALAASRAIRGRVTHADGLPVRRMRVQLSSTEALFPPSEALTDDDGRYEFTDVRPGTYTVKTATPGFPSASFGQQRPSQPGDVVVMSGDRPINGIDIALARASVITGRLLDENGDPIQHARIGTGRIGRVAGQQRLMTSDVWPSSVRTDDRGQYRLFNRQPGRHLVMAVVNDIPALSDADLPGYVSTFFPGTPNPTESQPVDIDPGEDVMSVDFAW